jgi:CDP-diacylglycerol---serine O-phosphatidyltransferase
MSRAAWWRYAVPNAVTSASLVFGVLGVQAAVSGRVIEAAWWGVLVVLTDKADGFLATALKGTSSFGVQLDSLADLVAFGVLPATVFHAFYSTHPELGWSEGWRLLALRGLCAAYVVCAALRLARYNVAAAQGPSRHFTGLPSTLTAGILLTLFVDCLKYADPRYSGAEVHLGWRPLDGLRLDGALRGLPLGLPLGGAAMLSTLRVPKLGRTFSRVVDVLLIVGVALGYLCGLSRRLPEYMSAAALWYVGVAFVYHLRTQRRGV